VDPANNWATKKNSFSSASIIALSRAYSGRGVARFGLQESTVHVWYPDARRAICAAGWE
jgi:hypothetical protein